MITYDNGIEIDGLDLLLDPSRKCDSAFVSHAHSDHARRHKKIIATPETALLYRHRYPGVPVRVLPFGRRCRLDGAAIELFPSGHMLGAAQVMIETRGKRIVYTGDFKLYPNLTCPPVETRRCDVLIMESTYGNPAYTFPPQNEVYTRIVMFIERCRADGQLPVLVGYAMGKAQEAVALVQQQGLEVCADQAVADICDLYRSAGVPLASTPLWSDSPLGGKVIVVTPQTLRTDAYRNLPRKRSVFLSGWSQGQGSARFCSADWSLPLSDHADFSQLLSYVESCRPRKIYTLHGSPKFAELLRERGWDAEYLKKGLRVSLNPGRRASSESGRNGQNYELF
jgi:Cft2 family RNA processing exonuclease